MNSVEIRVPAHLVEQLLVEVRRPLPYEAIVFAFASHARINGRNLVLVREIVVPPRSAFLSSNGHGARWSGAYSMELLNQATEKGLGVLWFHSHGDDPKVRMSADDLASAGQLLPRFQMMIPGRPHGSIVLGQESVDGLVALPGSERVFTKPRLRLIDGSGLKTWPLREGKLNERLLAQRQPLTISGYQKKFLKQSVVAVVGMSGGGSQVVPYLATFGVGEIIGIDYQQIDAGNCATSPNMTRLDSALHLRKTTAAKIRCALINPSVKFTSVSGRVPDALVVNALKRSDIIVGCVNNLHARSDLNEIAWRFCIPYVDIGLALTTDPDDEEPRTLSRISGNLFTLVPGGPCLWCADFLTRKKLASETAGRGRSYLQGTEQTDAFVASLNGTLASEAASEVLRLLIGFGIRREARRQFDGMRGTILEMSVSKRANCENCNFVLAAGNPLWTQLGSNN